MGCEVKQTNDVVIISLCNQSPPKGSQITVKEVTDRTITSESKQGCGQQTSYCINDIRNIDKELAGNAKFSG